jgi:hypothetical protein
MHQGGFRDQACLGHAVDVGIVGAYQRGDRLAKRRKLLEPGTST